MNVEIQHLAPRSVLRRVFPQPVQPLRIPATGSLAQFFKQENDGLDPLVEVRDVELLIGCVQIVVGQTKTHHHRGDF